MTRPGSCPVQSGAKLPFDPVLKTLGPNTTAPSSVLHENCIYCAGEDRRELLQAFAETGPAHACKRVKEYLRRITKADAPVDGEFGPDWYYRSYEFWRFPDFCLMLSGVGTGCLEPLLYEVLRANVVRKIVLVGTAGAMPEGKAELGRAYNVNPASAAGTGIDAIIGERQLPSRWQTELGETASTVSTDFYYGFAPGVVRGEASVHQRFEDHRQRKTDLVDMEVAQFYFFCENFGSDHLQYVAVKAAANAVGRGEQQPLNTGIALRSTLRAAFLLLNIPMLTKSSE